MSRRAAVGAAIVLSAALVAAVALAIADGHWLALLPATLGLVCCYILAMIRSA